MYGAYADFFLRDFFCRALPEDLLMILPRLLRLSPLPMNVTDW